MSLAPPATEPSLLPARLREPGYAIVDAAGVARLSGVRTGDFNALNATWDALPPDEYLRDGGRYRRRRHACYVADSGQIGRVPRRPHWQPVEYNALHGGIERWFEPLAPAWDESGAWPALLGGLVATADTLRGARPWYIEAHQFRIDTAGGIGRPTPEGAHRDGVDFVAVLLIARHGVKGGETRVFDADGPQGIRFTMAQPWSMLLLDDARVIHETTPIQPADAPEGDAQGHRDTLVITLRAGGFQGR